MPLMELILKLKAIYFDNERSRCLFKASGFRETGNTDHGRILEIKLIENMYRDNHVMNT